MGKKVLILSAHPDDAVTCMGGTICKLQAEGHSVSVFAFGNGDEDYAEPGGSAEAVRRYRENTEKAYAILDCQLECLWLPDRLQRSRPRSRCGYCFCGSGWPCH